MGSWLVIELRVTCQAEWKKKMVEKSDQAKDVGVQRQWKAFEVRPAPKICDYREGTESLRRIRRHTDDFPRFCRMTDQSSAQAARRNIGILWISRGWQRLTAILFVRPSITRFYVDLSILLTAQGVPRFPTLSNIVPAHACIHGIKRKWRVKKIMVRKSFAWFRYRSENDKSTAQRERWNKA